MRIEVKGARKRFGKVEALRGVDLEIPAGRRAALVGPNGSGKSTLIRALLGLIDCQGDIRLDGRSPYQDRIEVARRLAYVPQVAPALGATTGELVGLVCLTRGLPSSRVTDEAAGLGLELGAVARQPFRNLSGGTKQKVLLALAFAAAPSLLVLDEPTASLDEAARQRFFARAGALPPGTTVLLCSHRHEEVALLTSHVIELAEGLVGYDGPAPRPADAAAAVEAAEAGPGAPALRLVHAGVGDA